MIFRQVKRNKVFTQERRLNSLFQFKVKEANLQIRIVYPLSNLVVEISEDYFVGFEWNLIQWVCGRGTFGGHTWCHSKSMDLTMKGKNEHGSKYCRKTISKFSCFFYAWKPMNVFFSLWHFVSRREVRSSCVWHTRSKRRRSCALYSTWWTAGTYTTTSHSTESSQRGKSASMQRKSS